MAWEDQEMYGAPGPDDMFVNKPKKNTMTERNCTYCGNEIGNCTCGRDGQYDPVDNKFTFSEDYDNRPHGELQPIVDYMERSADEMYDPEYGDDEDYGPYE